MNAYWVTTQWFMTVVDTVDSPSGYADITEISYEAGLVFAASRGEARSTFYRHLKEDWTGCYKYVEFTDVRSVKLLATNVDRQRGVGAEGDEHHPQYAEWLAWQQNENWFEENYEESK